MKKFLLSFGLVASMLLSGQSRDLYSLAKGEYLGFNAVFDKDDNLYGYVAMYGYGKSGEKTKKFEYVFLDRNLNPVANKEFEGDITALRYYGFLDYQNKLLLVPSYDDYAPLAMRKLFNPRTMEVDLKTNEVKHRGNYQYQRDGSFKEKVDIETHVEHERERKRQIKQEGSYFFTTRYNLEDGGFFLTIREGYSNYGMQRGLKRFDKNRKLLWEHKYNAEGNKKNYESLTIIDADEKYVYASLTKVKGKEQSFFLQVFDMKTGKMVTDKPLDALANKHTWNYIFGLRALWRDVDNQKSFADKIVIVGRLYDEKNEDKSYGYVRWLIDKKTFESKVDEIKYSDFKEYLPKINKEGEVEKGYNLGVRDVFFLEDGRVGMLFEKFKVAGYMGSHKTTDMVYAFTDKDFKLNNVQVFDKEKNRGNIYADYLFSQYLNKGKDVVFFYRDYQKDKETKEKHWNLFINTLIGGNFNQEVIKISEKDKYFITPYVAKEGYILLREYNEKDKYNQIRLERLNY